MCQRDAPPLPLEVRTELGKAPREFHSEEYKQIRSEVVSLVEKVDQYSKYSVLVPTAIYSWLVTASLGTHTVHAAGAEVGELCLKLPFVMVVLAWLIPPVFVLFCGIITRAFGHRIGQMGAYLLKLEDALGAPRPLGWEKFNAPLMPGLARARWATWLVVLIACVAASAVGVCASIGVSTLCMQK